jgi:putative transposase
MSAATALSAVVGTAKACTGLGVARATLYRQRRPRAATPVRRIPPLQLVDAERAIVLDTLMSPRFVDYPPAQVYAILLDEGRYLCSIRTMYRLLASMQAVRERRDQRIHPVSVTAPALPYLLHPLVPQRVCSRMRVRSWSPSRLTTCGPGISPNSRPQ